VVVCRMCPRLVAWREHVAAEKRAAFVDEEYWGRPVPSLGDPDARMLVVGLAPAAHGGNRTGRMFTGDRSGDWLFASMHRTGFTNQAQSISKDDGLALRDAFIAAVVRCAPPANKPTIEERDTCLPYLVREMRALRNLRVIVALGAFGWDGALRAAAGLGVPVPRPKPRFGHLAEAPLGPWRLIGSFHPSQQNTFTGKLTEEMLDAVFERAREVMS
jgi:uracil-DNA glycosylase family 4